jgi:hypothetical protein
VIPLQAPAGVGTYEAGVALGTQVRHGAAVPDAGVAGAAQAGAANTDNQRLVFGAALAVHALMVAVAILTALLFSLIMRPSRARES